MPRTCLWIALGAFASSCAHPVADDKRVTDACRALVASAPHEFADSMTIVLALGPVASTPLIAALREQPDAPGVEAALATLGRLGGDGARELLLETVQDRAPYAAAAALAIGDCADATSAQPLLLTATDRLADPTLRAAACATLLRIGIRSEVRSLVRGILLAGTPHGRELERELGLPRRPRWAYERYLLQQALRDAAGEDFGLDTDAPWDAMLACADRVDSWLSR